MDFSSRIEGEPVLVTGGLGLLGSRLVPRLLAARARVRLLVHRPVDRARVPERVEVVAGDVCDDGAVRAAVRGVRAVYHLAAVTRKWLPEARRFHAVNVEAAIRLVRAAAEAGAERIVHVSSFTVFGPSPRDGSALDETARCDPRRLQNEYQRSKCEAHVALQALAERDGVPVVLVCPGVLYGPASQGHANPIAELMQRQLARRVLVFPGGGASIWTFSYLDDAARGLIAARALGRPGEAFILGGEARPLRDVFAWVEDRAPHRCARLGPPLWPFLAAGRMVELAARATRRTPRLTAAALRLLGAHWSFRSDLAVRRLGYTVTPLADGLLSTWQHLHDRHLAPAPPAAVPAA